MAFGEDPLLADVIVIAPAGDQQSLDRLDGRGFAGSGRRQGEEHGRESGGQDQDRFGKSSDGHRVESSKGGRDWRDPLRVVATAHHATLIRRSPRRKEAIDGRIGPDRPLSDETNPNVLHRRPIGRAHPRPEKANPFRHPTQCPAYRARCRIIWVRLVRLEDDSGRCVHRRHPGRALLRDSRWRPDDDAGEYRSPHFGFLRRQLAKRNPVPDPLSRPCSRQP